MQTRIFLAMIYLAAVGAFFLLPTELPMRQMALLPLVILVLGLLSFGTRRVPRLLLLVALLAAVTGFVGRRVYRTDSRTSFLVSRLDGDPYESKSRIFRKRIESALGDRSELKVLGHHELLRTTAEAEQLMRRLPEMPGVVWGNQKWVSITLPKQKPLSLGELAALKADPMLSPLRMVRSIPLIGLSFFPENASSEFIAALFTGLISSQTASPNAEIDLIKAGSVNSNWSTLSHRAYPWWRLGNYYLVDALDQPSIETASIQCAIWAYKIAHKFMRKGGNSELDAAISNNLALAILSGKAAAGAKSGKREAKKLLKSAGSVLVQPNPHHIKLKAPRVAMRNLAILSGTSKGKKKKHQNA